MPSAPAEWTVDMLDALPDDGQRYEIIDGALYVTPAPARVHQLVLGEFFVRLHGYLRPGQLARALMSPADVRKDDRRKNRVQPDVFAVRLMDGQHPEYPYALGDILLAIEMESPSNPLYDYHTKRQLYLRNGVPEYWVVNCDARIVSRFVSLADPGEVFSQKISWRPAGMQQALVIDIPALFEDALG